MASSNARSTSKSSSTSKLALSVPIDRKNLTAGWKREIPKTKEEALEICKLIGKQISRGLDALIKANNDDPVNGLRKFDTSKIFKNLPYYEPYIDTIKTNPPAPPPINQNIEPIYEHQIVKVLYNEAFNIPTNDREYSILNETGLNIRHPKYKYPEKIINLIKPRSFNNVNNILNKVFTFLDNAGGVLERNPPKEGIARPQGYVYIPGKRYEDDTEEQILKQKSKHNYNEIIKVLPVIKRAIKEEKGYNMAFTLNKLREGTNTPGAYSELVQNKIKDTIGGNNKQRKK
jgi:hypothetical protein